MKHAERSATEKLCGGTLSVDRVDLYIKYSVAWDSHWEGN